MRVGDPARVASRLIDVEDVVERVKAVPQCAERKQRSAPRGPADGEQQGDAEGKHEGADVADVMGVLEPVAPNRVEERSRREQHPDALGRVKEAEGANGGAQDAVVDHEAEL